MKILLLIILFLPFASSSQSVKNQKEFKALQSSGAYTIDNNGGISITRIIEVDSASKDDLFNRAQEYFTYNYGDGESVIQINDRETGRIVGKGIYREIASTAGLYMVLIDTWHILKIEAKDGRARVTVTLTEFIEDMTAYGGDSSDDTFMISKYYPFTEKGVNKGAYLKAFLASYGIAIKTIENLEGDLRAASKDW